jgi:nicotinate (nicotinamide) nucleotide adenylyltransferase
MTGTRRLGVLGGTFDPIHFGHIDAAEAARAAIGLDEIVLVPAHDPPHRNDDPHASSFHRFGLIALAIAERNAYRVSDVELTREGPSYTVDTLQHLHRSGWRPSQLFFILGTDAFAEIATWHEFPAVLDAAHFVVIARPGMTIDAALARAPAMKTRIQTLEGAHRQRDNETAIFLVQATTRDVSSTTIRQRLANRQPIDDLVPEPVARHILAHRLYGAVGDLHG